MLFEANLYGRLATIGTGARVVVSLVNTTYSAARLADPRLDRRKVRAVQALDTVLGRFRTDRFHAVSRAVKDDAVAGLRLPDDKVTVIERGRRPETLPVASPARRAAARDQLGLDPMPRCSWQSADRSTRRGTATCSRRCISSQTDPISCCWWQAGPATRATNSNEILATMPETAGRVQLLGHRSDVAEVLAAGDLFVFPSLFEGMPGAVIEAMASGLPIVASDIEPVREVVDIGANAVLVPPRDASALADAVRTLLDDPARRRHGSPQPGDLRGAFHDRTVGCKASSTSTTRLHRRRT